MKTKILLLALTVAVLSSCTTSYKTGQTPDDVYYSPTRPEEEYVKTEKEDDRQYRNDDEYYDDQYLRMKVRNRYRWSYLDDPFYYSRRYNFSTYNCCCYNNPWTPYSYWNNHYNPYYQGYVIINPKNVTYSAPRTFNLNSYNTNALTNNNYSNPKNNNSGTYSGNNNNTYSNPRNNNNSNKSNSGNVLRNIFNSNNNSGSSNNNSSSGNNNSSSSSSSSSGSSSGSSAPVRRF